MKMAQDLAGYSLGEADLLRRAMGKKKIAEMKKHEVKFIDGAAKNGVPQEVSKDLFDQMVKFAEYCLDGDTPIVTVEHGVLTIREIVEKQLMCNVYSVDENDLIYVQPIEQWHERGDRLMFEYELENGGIIRATPDHKFLTSDGRMLPINDIFEQGLDLAEYTPADLPQPLLTA